MRLGIIGCGLIGTKRARAAAPHPVVAVFDPQRDRAEKLAGECPGARVANSVVDLLAAPLDAVVIATTHDQLAPLAIQALQAGKHVLAEKPGARSAPELEAVHAVATRAARVVRVGFNHRFHPALLKAHELVRSGVLGPMMYIRGRYGHGGRIGYDKEWRAVPAISGGGEAIDQGIHLVDLSRWLMGDLTLKASHAPTYFWDMPVEDNAFMLLTAPGGEAAWLHATWTEWKNLFSLEIYGRVGKVQVDGLGGSYGPEKLTYYKMLPQLGPPETTVWEYPGPDESWVREFADFAAAIEGRAGVGATLDDAVAALRIIDQVKRPAGGAT